MVNNKKQILIFDLVIIILTLFLTLLLGYFINSITSRFQATNKDYILTGVSVIIVLFLLLLLLFFSKKSKTEQLQEIEMLRKKGIIAKDIAQEEEEDIIEEYVLFPGYPYNWWKIITETTKKAKSYAKLCDRYMDETTLDFLVKIPKNVRIQLLTTDKSINNNFLGAVKIFKKQHPNFSLRTSNPKDFHERVYITKGEVWVSNHSFKDLHTAKAKFDRVRTEKNVTKYKMDFENIWQKSKIIY